MDSAVAAVGRKRSHPSASGDGSANEPDRRYMYKGFHRRTCICTDGECVDAWKTFIDANDRRRCGYYRLSNPWKKGKRAETAQKERRVAYDHLFKKKPPRSSGGAERQHHDWRQRRQLRHPGRLGVDFIRAGALIFPVGSGCSAAEPTAGGSRDGGSSSSSSAANQALTVDGGGGGPASNSSGDARPLPAAAPPLVNRDGSISCGDDPNSSTNAPSANANAVATSTMADGPQDDSEVSEGTSANEPTDTTHSEYIAFHHFHPDILQDRNRGPIKFVPEKLAHQTGLHKSDVRKVDEEKNRKTYFPAPSYPPYEWKRDYHSARAALERPLEEFLLDSSDDKSSGNKRNGLSEEDEKAVKSEDTARTFRPSPFVRKVQAAYRSVKADPMKASIEIVKLRMQIEQTRQLLQNVSRESGGRKKSLESSGK